MALPRLQRLKRDEPPFAEPPGGFHDRLLFPRQAEGSASRTTLGSRRRRVSVPTPPFRIELPLLRREMSGIRGGLGAVAAVANQGARQVVNTAPQRDLKEQVRVFV